MEYTYPSPNYNYLSRYWKKYIEHESYKSGREACEVDKRDGLYTVSPLEDSFSWPFDGADNWEYDRRHGFNLWYISEDEQGQPDTLWRRWKDAYKLQKHNHYWNAAEKYRSIINEEPKSTTDALAQAFCCGNLSLLLGGYQREEDAGPSGSRNSVQGDEERAPARASQRQTPAFMRNDHEALLVSKVGAIAFRLPSTRFLYGRALLYGRDGAKQNISEGLYHLSEAGSARIGEAYYEIGRCYELGAYEEIPRNIALAQAFYVTSTKTVVPPFHSETWFIAQQSILSRVGATFSWAVMPVKRSYLARQPRYRRTSAAKSLRTTTDSLAGTWVSHCFFHVPTLDCNL